jgi:heme/copper-type cytochrome/quinol oxidase subunit 1
MALAVVAEVRAVRRPRPDATTLEWTLSSPPPFLAYDALPRIKDGLH